MSEESPDIIAAFDQATASLPLQAGVVASYRRALLKEGIPDPLLGQLTRDFQRDVFGQGGRGAQGEEGS